MFKQTSAVDWSSPQTASIASVYQEDFNTLLRDKKSIFKSVKDVSESFKEHVVHQTTIQNDYTTDSINELEQVNWSEIATTFVLNNPIRINNYA